MSGGLGTNMTYGANVAGGGNQMPPQPDARSGPVQAWDDALDFADSDAYQYGVMAGGVAVPSAIAGGSALMGGATLGAAGSAAMTVAGPLVVGAAAGFVAAKVGEWAGGHVGNVIADMMGMEPLAGPSEQPACKGDKIFHTKTGLVAGLMIAAVVVGVAAAAVTATVLTGGVAGPFVIAALAGAAGGLAGGFVGGIASSVGAHGEEKGEIADGSHNVHFEGKPVSHVTAPVACRDHGAKQVAEGSETVFVNGWPIGRKGHKTTCDGTIQTGRETIKLDTTTSSIRLDIDGGWAMRLTRTFVVISDFLPFPKGDKGDAPPANKPKGENPPPATRPDPATPHENAPNSVCSRPGDPVDVASGQVSDQRTDIDIPGTIPLRLMRTYRPGLNGDLGRNWACNWSQHLELGPRTVTYQDGEGVRITFHTPHNAVRSENLKFPMLELAGRRDGVMWIYDCDAQLFQVFEPRQGNRLLLTRIEDRNGNTIRFIRGEEGLRAVEHSDGFSLTLNSEAGLLRHAVLDADDVRDCVFSWTYSAQRLLTQAASSQAGTLNYRYDDHGRMTGWSDTGVTRAHYAYGADGRVSRNWSDSGHLGIQLDYDVPGRRTRVTNRQGAVTIYDWTDQGVVWKRTDPNGHVWLTEWGMSFNILAEVDPLGNRTTYDYDRKGRLVGWTDADGNKHGGVSFGPDDRPNARKDAGGAVSALRHDANGNLSAVDDPAGGTTIYRRNKQGQVLRIDRPDGRQQRIYYDALQRPSRYQDAAGLETLTRYDTEGRLVWESDVKGAVTEYDVTRSEDNPRGRARRIRHPDGHVTHVARDAEGQIAAVIDPSGERRGFAHGPFDALAERIDGLGLRQQLEYDSELRLTALVDEAGLRHEFARDKAGHVVAERDFAGRVTRYENDPLGRMIAKTTPDGVTTTYRWSPGGRLLGSDVQGQPELSITYDHDPAGRVIAGRMPGSEVRFTFDSLGRMTSEVADGRTIRSEYHASGTNRVERTGDVLDMGIAYSNAGHVETLFLDGRPALHFAHDTAGHEILRQSPDGFALGQGWDVARQLIEQVAGPLSALPPQARAGTLKGDGQTAQSLRLGALTHRTWRRDSAGRAVAIEDGRTGHTLMSYDARGQIAALRHVPHAGQDALTQYDYDASRNLTRITDDDSTTSLALSAGRVQQSGDISFVHDACGRVVEKTVQRAGDYQTWRYEWNAYNRLVAVTTPRGQRWAYRYDAFGRRIHRQETLLDGTPVSPANGTAWQWDGDQIAAEAPLAADGMPDWPAATHWVWQPDGFVPLARVAQGQPQFTVTDHTGAPTELVSADGKDVVWRGTNPVWGRADTQGSECPIRQQGQWFDAESGLHYNRFRYYDPDAAQYLSPDPIGLAGGTRPQAYVADPNSMIDPLGLACCGANGENPTPRRDDDTPSARRPHTDNTADRPNPNQHADAPDTSGPNTTRPDTSAGGPDVPRGKPKIEGRQVSDADWKWLRDRTPDDSIRAMVNEGVPEASPRNPQPDEWLPGQMRTGPYDADHIVPADRIRNMEGFGDLPRDQQLAILNDPTNYHGMSASANRSRGKKSFEDWLRHKRSGTPVNENLRQQMIQRERELTNKIQQDIYDRLWRNQTGGS
ncbi:MAG: hypothetical protein DI498_02900 [Paracoccus denitrificans]|nr:MAG: hypothetical protein DI498_02900 [Paracoccus denitrificans]PZO85489.1 MAG: hypothetical protein DI633_02900 [Paracoccus denitrificans]